MKYLTKYDREKEGFCERCISSKTFDPYVFSAPFIIETMETEGDLLTDRIPGGWADTDTDHPASVNNSPDYILNDNDFSCQEKYQEKFCSTTMKTFSC